jgi:hypothetical protein
VIDKKHLFNQKEKEDLRKKKNTQFNMRIKCIYLQERKD